MSATPELPYDWCHVHARREVADPDDYVGCVECGHIFRTEVDLLKAEFNNSGQVDLFRDSGRDVFACPFCSSAWMFPPGSGSLRP